MNELNWYNYLDLVKLIKENNYIEKWMSPIALVTYKYYGINIKFVVTNSKEIIFFVRYSKSENVDIDTNKWYVSQIFYFENSNKEMIKSEWKKYYKELNNIDNDNFDVDFANISYEMIIFFNLDKNRTFKTFNYISNYIYDCEKLKTFSGKRMQKKRNHLNAFINEKYNIKIVDIKEINQDELINYLITQMNEYNDEFRSYEIDIYKMFIRNEISKSNDFCGIVVFINDKIVGLTLGYKYNETYEIIIEKANKNIRGLYQFIIKTNLNYHNINTTYIDRQDDNGLDNLSISKKSYYPKYEIKRFYNVVS